MSLRDPQTQKLLLGAILLLGVGYAFYSYVYTPNQAEIADKQGQAERLERYNESAKQAAQGNRIAALEEESVSFSRRLEAFEELIPTREQVPQLLERIATAALEADVDLLSFTPLPAEPGTFYTEQFYEAEVRGGYHEIGNFLTRIANLPRIIKPTITELIGERVEQALRGRVPNPGEPPPRPQTLVRAKLQLSTYVLPGGEAPVATGAAAPGSTPAAGLTGEPSAAAPAPPPAPTLGERISPGVAPALEAQRAAQAAAAAAAAAQTTGGAAPPAAESSGAPAGVMTPPAATPPTGIGVSGAELAGAGPTVSGVGAAPAQPPAPATLPPAAGAPAPTADQSRPGALPLVGER